jgi:hypothetical protein
MDPVRQMGTAVNTGLIFYRSTKRKAVVRFILDAIRRGLIEFYLR